MKIFEEYFAKIYLEKIKNAPKQKTHHEAVLDLEQQLGTELNEHQFEIVEKIIDEMMNISFLDSKQAFLYGCKVGAKAERELMSK